jgi:hypothetical protein
MVSQNEAGVATFGAVMASSNSASSWAVMVTASGVAMVAPNSRDIVAVMVSTSREVMVFTLGVKVAVMVGTTAASEFTGAVTESPWSVKSPF